MKPTKTLRTILAGLLLVVTGSAQASISIETVIVGDTGNASDPTTGYGSVPYAYRIGKYEVMIEQYAAFLNAVAGTDTYSLYSTDMGTNSYVAGIARSGSSGSYAYAVIGSGNRPVTDVSWFDAARFANWMANGQPTGAQGNATTENGAYTLNGATSGVHFTKNAVNPNTGTTTMWWIPSENEWYKAAYYQPQAQGGDTDNYWLYPTGTNNAPENIIGAGANQANFYAGRYSVTQSPSFESSQNYLTDGGAFSQSASFYGTYDQGGNVWEWNDGETDSFRGFRGGSWWGHSGGDFAHSLQSSYRWGESASWEDSSLGFRVASVPEPSAVALQAFRILGLSGDMTNGFTITWTCEAGYSYQLQYSDTLQAGDWHNLGTSRVWSSGELTLSHKDITAVGRDKRFYKIVRTALP